MDTQEKLSDSERIMELEARLSLSQMEVRNCHILLTILASRSNGAVITDEEMQNAGALGVLQFVRDDRIPGCSILVRTVRA